MYMVTNLRPYCLYLRYVTNTRYVVKIKERIREVVLLVTTFITHSKNWIKTRKLKTIIKLNKIKLAECLNSAPTLLTILLWLYVRQIDKGRIEIHIKTSIYFCKHIKVCIHVNT